MLAIWLFCLSSQVSRAQLLTVTPHELLPENRIVVESQETPPWKVLWDEARKSALSGDFDKAVRQYKALLVLKSNLEEARWELARVLIYTRDWNNAADLLELLIESSPENTGYVNTLGKVMLEVDRFERAVDLFKRVYEKKSSDQTALAGLVEGLTKLERKNEALPYLEQLARQEPTNRGVRRYLAVLLYETENYEKARAHFTILSRNEDVGFDVLYKTAKTYEKLGFKQQAAIYWERILGREPDNTEAHQYLAEYYEGKGQLDRTLSHLKVILDQNPGEANVLLRLARVSDKAGEYDKAISYFKRIPAEKRQSTEITQRIKGINAAGGQKTKTQTPVSSPAAVESRQITALQETISKYQKNGRYWEAVPTYQQLFRLSPDDQEILTALTHDLISISENEGPEMMVRFLSETVPEDVTLYRKIAELLRQKLGERELLTLFNKILEFNPDDPVTRLELAIIHLHRGDYELSFRYFSEFSEADCMDIRCLDARASLAEKIRLPAQELQDLEALLEQQPERFEVRLKVVAIAARLGLLDKALFHAGYLQNLVSMDKALELKIYLAQAYQRSGYLNRAIERYQRIIDQAAGEKKDTIIALRMRSRLGLAESYRKLGLVYEAEQVLRKALANEENRVPFLIAVFHLYLETDRDSESEIWLEAISRELDDSQENKLLPGNSAWLKDFFQAEMYSAAGDHDLARELFNQAEGHLLENGNFPTAFNSTDNTITALCIRKGMVKSYLEAGEHEEAEKIILSLRNNYRNEPELLVLAEEIYRDWDKVDKAEDISNEAKEYGAYDFGRQLILAELYGEYGNSARQAEMARAAVIERNESLAAKYLLVDANERLGNYADAIELLEQYLLFYPENTWFLTRQAELQAKVGAFSESLEVADMLLAENKNRPDILLLKARLLWEMESWQESIAQYELVLEPQVREILEHRFNELTLSVDQAPEKSSWWDIITFSEDTPLEIHEIVMAPPQVIDFSRDAQRLNSVAAEYYAQYRWQERLSKELAVRRSVMNRNYYHAAKRLEKLIDEYGANDFLLFDLAGLYSRLDRLGDEAAIYVDIQRDNKNFPGLSEAVQRNYLKRQPQIYLAYDVQEDDGWGGYKAVRRETVAAGWNYYQDFNKQWALDIARNNYESTRDVQNLSSWRTFLTYDLKLTHNTGLLLGGGIEKLESGHDDTFLWTLAFTGKIGDEMRSVFSVKQDVVTDTIASLKRNITRREYKIEFLFDLFPRVLLGGDFNFIDYSDSNWTNNYTFWASYILIPEPTSLEISYNYDLYDSREGYKPGTALADGFAPEDHPYWLPINYWVTRFSVNFKHQLSNDTLARGVPSYYTIGYFLGYDSDDNDLHELRASFNVEIAQNYIISASYGYQDLDVFQHEELYLSLMYRF